jgi:hypothetical protein
MDKPVEKESFVQTCMWLDGPQWLRIRQIALTEGVSAASIVREALAAYLQKIDTQAARKGRAKA